MTPNEQQRLLDAVERLDKTVSRLVAVCERQLGSHEAVQLRAERVLNGLASELDLKGVADRIELRINRGKPLRDM